MLPCIAVLLSSRLPRRYSNDKNRDSSAPIVGTSGSTPLHFAAANGNTNVVSLLLLHGAHANHPDKHGVTPELIAKQNGWLECAQVLRNWILNKDKDLKDREATNVAPTASIPPASSSRDASLGGTDSEPLTPPPGRRRLQVKQSIDTALNMFKSPSSVFESKCSSRNTPPASPTRTVDPTASPESPIGNGRINSIDASRRPSLPHVFAAPPRSSEVTNHGSSYLNGDARRPRSAGTDAEREEEDAQSTFPRNISGKRLGSKYSLMNMFRKAHGDTSTGATSPDFRPGSSPKQSLTLQASQSALSQFAQTTGPTTDTKKDKDAISTSPTQYHAVSDASIRSQLSSGSPLSFGRRILPNLDDLPLSDDSHGLTHKRVHSDIPRDTAKSGSPVSMISVLRKDNNRDRSYSNGSSYSIPGKPSSLGDGTPTTAGETESGKGFSRSGIFFGHGRSSSSGKSTPLSSSYRALRFEYSLNDPEDAQSAGTHHSLRSVNSAGSLTHTMALRNGPQSHYRGVSVGRTNLPPISAPPGLPQFDVHAGSASPKHHRTGGRSSSSTIPSARRREGRVASLSSSSESYISLLGGANDGQITEAYGKFPLNMTAPSLSLPEQTSVSAFRTSEGDAPDTNGIRSGKTNRGVNGRPAFEIDISAISSHAQAEALVQQTQKEILQMGEQEILLTEGTPGSTPLSARLAAYGESLALERKLREEMQSPRKIGYFDSSGRLSPSLNGLSSARQTPGHLRIARQYSQDDRLGDRKETHQPGSWEGIINCTISFVGHLTTSLSARRATS